MRTSYRGTSRSMIKLGEHKGMTTDPSEIQVPASEDMVYKVLALARLVCPQANIPSTTALATVNRINGRQLGLMRGANVVMPNFTPRRYREKYEIYPDKACINDNDSTRQALHRSIASLGRILGRGAGGRRR